ncbi:MAG: hypothetical protein ACP5P4_08050 [Steroidobacteraceae bacterium]
MSRVARETILNSLLQWIENAFTTSFSATIQKGSTTLTNPSSTAGLFVGFPVSGNGIPEGTYITSVTPLTLSQPATANGAAVVLRTGFALVDRRADFGDQVPCPALFLRCLDEEYQWQDNLQVLILKPEICIVSKGGADPDAVPESALNTYMDALDQAFKPDDPQRQRFTLGGTVFWCRLNGKVEKATGDLGPQSQVWADIEIIVP